MYCIFDIAMHCIAEVMGELSWSEAVAGLTERALLDSFTHQVQACKSFEGKIEKVLTNLAISKRISGWLSACGETKYSKSGGNGGQTA